jgi:hypothetical protein
MKFNLIILLIIVFIFSSYGAMAILPSEYATGSGQATCMWYCRNNAEQCDNICVNTDYGACSPEETGSQCSQRWMDAAWRCKIGCAQAFEGCKHSCSNYESLSGISAKSYYDLELENKQVCNAEEAVNGCCPGYTQTKHKVCCREGYDSKTGEGGLIACVKKEAGEKLKDVIIKLSKNEFEYAKDKKLTATFTFRFVDSIGNALKTEGKPYPGNIIVEAEDYPTEVTFSIKPKKELDASGNLDVEIEPKNINILGAPPEKMRINVYNSAKPEKKVSFSMTLPKITIKRLEKVTPDKQWQNSWATYVIEVNDPYNSLKHYAVTAEQGNVKLDEVDLPRTGYKKTKENTVAFGWQSPRMTQEVRMNYGTKIAWVLINQAGSKATDKLGDKAKNFANQKRITNRLDMFSNSDAEKVANAERLIKTIDNWNEGVEKIENVGNTGAFIESLKSIYKSDMSDEDPYYNYLKLAMESGSAVEGLLGSYQVKSTPVSFALASAKAFIEVTDEMKEIAKAEKISKPYKIKVDVSTKKDQVSKDITVDVEGYSMILVGEDYVPFK